MNTNENDITIEFQASGEYDFTADYQYKIEMVAALGDTVTEWASNLDQAAAEELQFVREDMGKGDIVGCRVTVGDQSAVATV